MVLKSQSVKKIELLSALKKSNSIIEIKMKRNRQKKLKKQYSKKAIHKRSFVVSIIRDKTLKNFIYHNPVKKGGIKFTTK